MRDGRRIGQVKGGAALSGKRNCGTDNLVDLRDGKGTEECNWISFYNLTKIRFLYMNYPQLVTPLIQQGLFES